MAEATESQACIYLRDALRECLTEAVAELVLTRPADPIDFLAHHLYKYRTLHPLPEHGHGTRTLIPPTRTSDVLLNHSHRRDDEKLPKDKVELVHDVDDDMHYDYGVDNAIVHSACRVVFCDIGDLFDDDDVT